MINRLSKDVQEMYKLSQRFETTMAQIYLGLSNFATDDARAALLLKDLRSARTSSDRALEFVIMAKESSKSANRFRAMQIFSLD